MLKRITTHETNREKVLESAEVKHITNAGIASI